MTHADPTRRASDPGPLAPARRLRRPRLRPVPEKDQGLPDHPAILDATEGEDVDPGPPGHVARMAAQMRHGIGEARPVHVETQPMLQIGRASCRARVCQYVLISVVAVALINKHVLPPHVHTLIMSFQLNLFHITNLSPDILTFFINIL